jgi:hypothetical protein
MTARGAREEDFYRLRLMLCNRTDATGFNLLRQSRELSQMQLNLLVACVQRRKTEGFRGITHG